MITFSADQMIQQVVFEKFKLSAGLIERFYDR